MGCTSAKDEAKKEEPVKKEEKKVEQPAPTKPQPDPSPPKVEIKKEEPKPREVKPKRKLILDTLKDNAVINPDVIKELKLDEVETGEAISFPVVATYNLESKLGKLLGFDTLEIGLEGKIRGKGKDEAGEFKLRGIFGALGVLYMEKEYTDKSKPKMILKGRIALNVVHGVWLYTDNSAAGSFEIIFTMKEWTNVHTFLGIKEGNVWQGLFYDDDYVCWALVKETGKKDGEHAMAIEYMDCTFTTAKMKEEEESRIAVELEGKEIKEFLLTPPEPPKKELSNK